MHLLEGIIIRPHEAVIHRQSLANSYCSLWKKDSANYGVCSYGGGRGVTVGWVGGKRARGWGWAGVGACRNICEKHNLK